MKPALKNLSVLALAPFAVSLAQAATVTGTVKGPEGAAFRGAFIQAQNAATKITVSVLSDKDGRYRIENLPAGQYQLQIRAPGFRTEPHAGVMLAAEQNLA